MKHVVLPLTLIDFFGILLPGAVFVLVVNAYICNITNLCTLFFGYNEIMLCAYFLAISYLCGSMLHQTGWIMESHIWKVEEMHEKWFKDAAVKNAYKVHFGHDVTENYADAGKRVFAYVQKDGRPPRILVFNAFYTMSRTLVIVALLFIAAGIFAVVIYYEKYIKFWPLIVLCVCAVAVFRSRWVRFEKNCVDEAYMLFISEQKSDSKPQSTDYHQGH